MIKVYTPKEWMSLFHGAPSLVIGQGKIYAGNTYHNLVSKDVVGVWKGDLIYGPDYYKSGAKAIGKIKTKGTVKEVYGVNDGSESAAPLFYIVGNKVYTAKEYSKWFKSPSAYIENKAPTPTEGKGSQGRASSSQKTQPGKDPTSADYNIGPVGWGLLLVLVLAATAVGFFTGYYRNLTLLFLILSLASVILAMFFCKEGILPLFLCAEYIIPIGFFSFSYITDMVAMNTLFPWSLWEIILACIASCATAIFCSGLTLILSVIFGGVRKLFSR